MGEKVKVGGITPNYQIRKFLKYDVEVYIRTQQQIYVDVFVECKLPTIHYYDVGITIVNGLFGYSLDYKNEEDGFKFGGLDKNPKTVGGYTTPNPARINRNEIRYKLWDIGIRLGILNPDSDEPPTTSIATNDTDIDVNLTDDRLKSKFDVGNFLMNEPLLTNTMLSNVKNTGNFGLGVGSIFEYPQPIYILKFNKAQYSSQYPNGITVGSYTNIEYILVNYTQLQKLDTQLNGIITDRIFLPIVKWKQPTTGQVGDCFKQFYRIMNEIVELGVSPTLENRYKDLFVKCKFIPSDGFYISQLVERTPNFPQNFDFFNPKVNIPLFIPNFPEITLTFTQLMDYIGETYMFHFFRNLLFNHFSWIFHIQGVGLLISPKNYNFYILQIGS